MSLRDALINLAYLAASVGFILGIKGLSSPKTARRANMIGASAMLIAIIAALVDRSIIDYKLILAGVIVGSGIGATMAFKTPMTSMPQMVALLNGFGGAASLLVSSAALYESTTDAITANPVFSASIAAGGLVGAVTLTGSILAFAKLQEIMTGSPVRYPLQQPLNAAMFLACIVLGGWVVHDPTAVWAFWILAGIAAVLGITLVLPIGGADMPVVISLLNSYSGIAAGITGFILRNNVLIISGALVGASGIILTQIMCKAMNRSMLNVVFGTFGDAGGSSVASQDEVYAGKIKSTNADEIAMILDAARSVMFVPGYGLAVSQAQHTVRDLANALKAKGVDVKYAIHPVAGRMPGHMNVLLAEADIPYDELLDMDTANPMMPQTDVAIVLGANDVVNPDARENPKSPIAGMPILDVDKANTVIVVKRSLSPGFAGIPNPLFAAQNSLMFFADGKKAIQEIIAAVKAL